ncbi:hypothetical protein MNBD_PLANCTO03-1277 [hydrothermal vent metagenome]|uniref:DUF3299 domain-containing protein n=1 Tax=hydrothermal vent metagenome TaxID=652676 RepID=A0A3B1DAB4_9ZZZZ
MKVFWALILALVLATGGLVLKEFGTGSGSASGAVQDVAAPEDRLTESRVAPVPIEEPEAAAEPIVAHADAEAEAAARLAEALEFLGNPVPLVEETSAESASTNPMPTATTPTNADSAPTTDSTGALVLNSRYTLPGSGTADDPYIIDFPMLIALEQDYDGKTSSKAEVPAWIKPLDGKFVRITGFIGFPYISPTADECLVLLNQWDGCCIGTPPTLYDAIEVQLAEPIDLENGVFNYGTLTGVFRTDPYLVNGWLIGLYVMDEARIDNAGSRNQMGF